MASLLKKLTLKTLCGDLKAIAREIPLDGGVTDLAKIYGIAEGLKAYKSQYGDGHALVGQFGGVDMITGEVSRSTQCLIPQPMHDMIVSALESTDKVEFALVVRIKRRDDLAIGYEFIEKPVVQAEAATDPLAHLVQKFDALPAPDVQTPYSVVDDADVKPSKSKKAG